MRDSRCFRDGGGSLGCISYHDPHESPAPEAKVSYYRKRCLACHADRGCSLPRDDRLARAPDDSCVRCHMPRRAVADIAHVASTLHSIPRHAVEGEAPGSGVPDAPDPGGPPLVLFRRDRPDAKTLEET